MDLFLFGLQIPKPAKKPLTLFMFIVLICHTVPDNVNMHLRIQLKNVVFSMFPGIVPSITIQLDIFWKEMDADSDWVRCLSLSFACNIHILLAHWLHGSIIHSLPQAMLFH